MQMCCDQKVEQDFLHHPAQLYMDQCYVYAKFNYIHKCLFASGVKQSLPTAEIFCFRKVWPGNCDSTLGSVKTSFSKENK